MPCDLGEKHSRRSENMCEGHNAGLCPEYSTERKTLGRKE